MRRIITAVMIACLTLAAPLDAFAAKPKKKAATEDNKYASIVIDAASGTVISEKNADKQRYPASLTKVMTLMLLFEALENGNVRLNDKITVSPFAASQQPSKLGLKAGSSIKVEDAILAVVTKSANDISVAIGEHISGSESRFALRMTKRAHDIGMAGTTFRNASGLPNPGQTTTARDMATLARYILTRYPRYYHYFGTKQFTYRGVTMTNHNRLMNSYPGMDGFKTGFINASGFNLIASARQDGRRLIGVVFGGKSWKSRNDHMAGLLDAGFSDRATKVAAANPDVQQAKTATAYTPPPLKPVADAIPIAPSRNFVQQEESSAAFTTLGALDRGRKIKMPAAQPPAPAISSATQAATATKGDYTEATGQGDYESPEIEAADRMAALQTSLGVPTQQPSPQAQNPQHTLQLPRHMRPAQGTPQSPVVAAVPAFAASDLWSVQIGAYTSRVATDDALRTAATRLPPQLAHASPQVVPLQTAEGILFRARLGNFTQAQASDACRYFRDCLPVAPR